MSLIYILKEAGVWNDFLERKKELSHLPDKVIKNYEKFISNKEYESIVEKIVSETYNFSIPRKALIGKKSNPKKRAVYMYSKTETYILKLITYLLYEYDYLFSPNLYSFRQNNGVKKAIYNIVNSQVIGRKYAYKVDIKNYFNSIPIEQMLESLKIDLNDEKLWRLINSILTNDEVKYNGEIIKEQKGIMAGMPISAFLANYYLKDLDKYFYENKIMYIRYADDIITFADTEMEVINNAEVIKSFLKEKGLSINQEKEFFYTPKDKIEFLGFSFEGRTIDISANSFKKIKGKIRRTARGLRRWMIKKNAKPEGTLKAMNRKYNQKFFGKNEDDLTWKYWFFPIINTTNTLKEIDSYMQEEQRYLITGVHNKRNFEKVPYDYLKKCNYKSLVNEYYKTIK